MNVVRIWEGSHQKLKFCRELGYKLTIIVLQVSQGHIACEPQKKTQIELIEEKCEYPSIGFFENSLATIDVSAPQGIETIAAKITNVGRVFYKASDRQFSLVW